MIGYHCDNEKIADSTGVCALGDWLSWLLYENQFEDKIFYDLDQAVAAILKATGITEDEGRKLQATHKLYLLGSGIRLAYYPGKVFTIDYGYGPQHPYAYFYNAKQYMAVHHEDCGDIEYLTDKAKKAQVVGESILEAYEVLGITSKSLTSPIKAFDKSGMYPKGPTVDDIPEEAGEFAYQCVKGNWVESFSLGHWGEAYDYDLNGAYASELCNLMDTRRGRWIKDAVMPIEAEYGFTRCKVNLNASFHPIIFSKGDMLYTPTGEWETYLTFAEIEFIEWHELGTVEILEGWWWLPNMKDMVVLPYEETVKNMWMRRTKDDEVLDAVAKRILAGIWGKMLELRGTQDEPEFGPYFNPVYGAIVESNIRLRVGEACLGNGVIPLHVAVDGMIVDRQLKLSDEGGELGQWRLSHEGRCLIVGSGIVGMEGKGADEDFSITYDGLAQLLSNKPKADMYEMTKLAPVTLSKGLNSAWDRLGDLESLTRSICVGDETKRCYPKGPRCGGDLLRNTYGSEPWDIAVVQGIESTE